MRVRKVILTKGKQKLILQGMSHIGTVDFYKKIQMELDLYTRDGYEILFEGLQKSLVTEFKTQKELQARRLLRCLHPIILSHAVNESLLSQEVIKYPINAIAADLKLSDVARLLPKSGLRWQFLLWIFHRDKKTKLAKNLVELVSFNKSNLFHKVLLKYIVRNENIFINTRNKVVVDLVSSISSKNILVHYGDFHLENLVESFKKDGWSFVKFGYFKAS